MRLDPPNAKSPQNVSTLNSQRAAVTQRKCLLCVADELILAEHSLSLKKCASERSFQGHCERWELSPSLYPLLTAGAATAPKIYEVTVWVAAKLANHYCSLSTLNSNFILLIREQWEAILRAQ